MGNKEVKKVIHSIAKDIMLARDRLNTLILTKSEDPKEPSLEYVRDNLLGGCQAKLEILLEVLESPTKEEEGEEFNTTLPENENTTPIEVKGTLKDGDRLDITVTIPNKPSPMIGWSPGKKKDDELLYITFSHAIRKRSKNLMRKAYSILRKELPSYKLVEDLEISNLMEELQRLTSTEICLDLKIEPGATCQGCMRFLKNVFKVPPIDSSPEGPEFICSRECLMEFYYKANPERLDRYSKFYL